MQLFKHYFYSMKLFNNILPLRVIAVLFLAVLLSMQFMGTEKAAAQTGCTLNPTSASTVTATVNISAAGNYKVWSRIMAPNTNDNSYYLQIDGLCAVNVGDSTSITPNAWTWVDYQNGNTGNLIAISLVSAGNHTVKMTAKENKVKLDKIVFVPYDSTCVPTGLGDNCGAIATTITPTTVLTISPTAIPTPSSVTPTMYCLGSCPTDVPTGTITPTGVLNPTNGTVGTITVTPVVSQAPIDTPMPSNPVPTVKPTTPPGNGGGNNGGLINMLLQFFLLIIQLLLQLLGIKKG